MSVQTPPERIVPFNRHTRRNHMLACTSYRCMKRRSPRQSRENNSDQSRAPEEFSTMAEPPPPPAPEAPSVISDDLGRLRRWRQKLDAAQEQEFEAISAQDRLETLERVAAKKRGDDAAPLKRSYAEKLSAAALRSRTLG